MKFRADRKNSNNANSENAASVDVDGQFLKDNLTTMEKMHQLRTRLESKKRDKQNPKFAGTDIDATATGGGCEMGPSFGEQCVNNLLGPPKMDGNRPVAAAAAAAATAAATVATSTSSPIDNDHVDCRNVSNPFTRRMYFPPLKIPNNGSMSFKKTIDGSAVGKKCIRSEYASSANDSSSYPILSNSMLNKHGMAKTCMRSSTLTPKQKPSTAELISGGALFDADVEPIRTESIRKKPIMESDDAIKTKAFGQHLIELIRTSKMPLSPSWQDISEAKATFEATYTPTATASSPIVSSSANNSDSMVPVDALSLNELQILPSVASSSRNYANSEMHRSKLRDNIRRGRSFKALTPNDYIIEEDNHYHTSYSHNHSHHQYQQHSSHQYHQLARSSGAASGTVYNILIMVAVAASIPIRS